MFKRLEALLKAIKTKAIDPSIKQSVPNLPKLQAAGVKPPKLPGLKATSKKNPVKQAEQLQDKDIKDQAMRDATSEVKINKSTGQWSLEDAGYQGIKSSKV